MSTVRFHSPPARTTKRVSPRWGRQRPITRGGASDHPPAVPAGPPTIVSVSPTSKVVLSPQQLFTVTGTGFGNFGEVVVDWTAPGPQVSQSVTDIISPTTLTFILPASALDTVGTITWTAQFAGDVVAGPDITVTAATVLNSPGSYTIPQVQAYVDAHPEDADEVLVLEQAGQARITLIDWLQGFISHRDEGTVP